MGVVVNFGPKTTGKEIVSLELAKKNSNIDHEFSDDLFELYLDGIESEIENYLGIPVLPRAAAEVMLNSWEQKLKLPYPNISITKIEWLNTENAATEIPESDYTLFKEELSLGGKPNDFKLLKITASMGFDPVPADIKNAALLMFSERETYRENRPLKYNLSAQNLLRPYKRY